MYDYRISFEIILIKEQQVQKSHTNMFNLNTGFRDMESILVINLIVFIDRNIK